MDPGSRPEPRPFFAPVPPPTADPSASSEVLPPKCIPSGLVSLPPTLVQASHPHPLGSSPTPTPPPPPPFLIPSHTLLNGFRSGHILLDTHPLPPTKFKIKCKLLNMWPQDLGPPPSTTWPLLFPPAETPFLLLALPLAPPFSVSRVSSKAISSRLSFPSTALKGHLLCLGVLGVPYLQSLAPPVPSLHAPSGPHPEAPACPQLPGGFGHRAPAGDQGRRSPSLPAERKGLDLSPDCRFPLLSGHPSPHTLHPALITSGFRELLLPSCCLA